MDQGTGEHPPHDQPTGEVSLEPTGVVRRRRPMALWAVLAAVAVAAGAVAVRAADDEADAPALPVALGSTLAAGSAESAAADSMPAWITYVADEGLPSLGGEADAYRLAGGVTEADVAALARALGVDGEVSQQGGLWSVRGQAASLEVSEGQGAPWYLYGASPDVAVARPGTAAGGGSAGCDPEASDGGCTPTTFVETATTVIDPEGCTASDGPAECLTGECPPEGPCAIEGDEGCTPEECLVDPVPLPEPIEPLPAADLPSEDDARRIALDLLAATGMAVGDAAVTVDGPYDAWYVTVEPRLGGVPSGLRAGVSVGPDGVVTSANGYLATPAQVGRYPILDTRAAIERANAAVEEVPAALGGDGGTASPDAGSTDVTTTHCAALMPECGYDVGAPDATEPCKVQADGSEICSYDPCPPATTIPGEAPPAGDECPLIEVPPCVEPAADPGTTTGAVAPADDPVESPAVLRCTPPEVQPEPEPAPPPEPAPIEVVLVDAEPALQLLAAIDGSTDAYLVPAYRFTAADGSTVDLPAVADDALAPPSPPEPATTETVAPPPPETVPPEPVDPCEVLEEGEATGTTHTVVPDPDCDPQGAVELGVPYDVAVIAHCGHITNFDGRWWSTVDVVTDLGAEAGALTLEAPDRGTFEGGGVTATFEARGPAEEYPGCD